MHQANNSWERTQKSKLFYLAITFFIIEIYTRIMDIPTRSGYS